MRAAWSLSNETYGSPRLPGPNDESGPSADAALLDANDGRGIIEAEIHLEKRLKRFR